MDVYKKCPIMENENFLLRLVKSEDVEDLWNVYSDKRAVPFFNSDNCDGDDFYYETLARMEKAVEFWTYSYDNGWFVRWSIVDKKTEEAVGTLEAFYRGAEDFYDGYCLFRIDFRSDYEKSEVIEELLKLIEPDMYLYFSCDKCMTKAIPQATERCTALKKCGFEKSEIPLIGGNDRKEYYDYWVKMK